MKNIVVEDYIWAKKHAIMDLIKESKKIGTVIDKKIATNFVNEHYSKLIKENKGKVITEGIDDLKKWAAEKGGQAVSAVEKKIDPMVQSHFDKEKASLNDAIKSATARNDTDGVQALKDRLSKVETQQANFNPRVGGEKYTRKIAQGVVGGAAGVGIVGLITAAYYIWKRFFSSAARACKGKSGAEKTACMKNYKIKGAGEAIKKLEAGKRICKSKGNPSKCVASIDKQIASWKSRMASYQG